MSKHVILYRDNNFDECKYIELDNDGVIRLDYKGKPIVSNAHCSTRIDAKFENIETWVTEDVFNRLKNTNGDDTFSDVSDMIAHKEHEEFEAYIRESEIEKICVEYALDEEDVKDIIDNYNVTDDYFDANIISYIWDDAYEIAENYVDECCSIDSFLINYIDYDRLSEAIIEAGYYYELYDGRVVQYN